MAATDRMAAARDARAAQVALRQSLSAGTVAVAALLRGGYDQATQDAAGALRIGDLLAASPTTRNDVLGIAGAAQLDHLNHRVRDLTTATRHAMADHITRETP